MRGVFRGRASGAGWTGVLTCLRVINDRTRGVVAGNAEMAVTRRDRRKGLLGREALDADAALVLSPCIAVHTAFMKFPIDVAFIDRQGHAVRLVHALRPWRVAASVRAYSVIELAAGRLAACGVEVGDRLYVGVRPHIRGDSTP